jgi:hypothetical protein
MQEKEWGVIITWTYTEPPYIKSGEELCNDLVLAYENGAKCILIFDSNKNYTKGILMEEHLAALKQSWEYMQNNPRENSATSDKVGYVLPKNYGYGFRGPNDKIWGLWEADSLANPICKTLGNLMEEYGPRLDIIYDEGLESANTYGYSKLFFWNSSSSPTEFVYTLTAVASVAVVGTYLVVYFWNRKKPKTTQNPL